MSRLEIHLLGPTSEICELEPLHQLVILPIKVGIFVDTEELQFESRQNVSDHQLEDVIEKPE
jgi:hypothetical protein